MIKKKKPYGILKFCEEINKLFLNAKLDEVPKIISGLNDKEFEKTFGISREELDKMYEEQDERNRKRHK